MYILSQFQKKRENHVHQLERTVSANSVLARPTQSLGEHLVRNSPAGALVALAESPACRNPQSIVHLQGEGLRQASSCPKGSASTQERQRGLPNSLSCTLSDTQGSGGELPQEAGIPHWHRPPGESLSALGFRPSESPSHLFSSLIVPICGGTSPRGQSHPRVSGLSPQPGFWPSPVLTSSLQPEPAGHTASSNPVHSHCFLTAVRAQQGELQCSLSDSVRT